MTHLPNFVLDSLKRQYELLKLHIEDCSELSCIAKKHMRIELKLIFSIYHNEKHKLKLLFEKYNNISLEALDELTNNNENVNVGFYKNGEYEKTCNEESVRRYAEQSKNKFETYELYIKHLLGEISL